MLIYNYPSYKTFLTCKIYTTLGRRALLTLRSLNIDFTFQKGKGKGTHLCLPLSIITAKRFGGNKKAPHLGSKVSGKGTTIKPSSLAKPLSPKELPKPMPSKHYNANNVGGNILPGHGFKILESLETPKKASSIAKDLPGASNNIDRRCSENKAPSTLPEASVKEVSTDIKTSFMGDYLAVPLSKATALIATQSNQTFMDKTDFYDKLVGKKLQVELLHKGRMIPISSKRLIARTVNNIEEEFKLDIEATYYLDSPYVPSCNLQETPHTLANLSYGDGGLRINLQTPIIPNSFSIDIGLFSLNNLYGTLKDNGKYKIDRFSFKILIKMVEQVTNETHKKPLTSISIKKKKGKLLPKPFISDE
jgi:hypothetical protein